MAKDKLMYVCDHCGQESAKWLGKCPSCGQWNTFKEIRVQASAAATSAQGGRGARPVGGVGGNSAARPIPIAQIRAEAEPRMDMHDDELNRVLGGGLVPGSLVLLGGEPGIGKSTLVLQTVLGLTDKKVLYVSGEESARQLKLRADRLTAMQQGPASGSSTRRGTKAGSGQAVADGGREAAGTDETSQGLLVVCDTSLETIFTHIENERPDIVIIDSIQTIYTEGVESSAGSLAQIRECAQQLLKYVKTQHHAALASAPDSADAPLPGTIVSQGLPPSIILIGHINKEGTIAGPKVLEHIVDTVLQFEGDQHYVYRILRAQKNRFGSTSELGIYEMRQDGLRQVSNPSELLMTDNHEGLSGVAICAAIEGVRPFLIETQALVSTAAYGTAQRQATGFDYRRLNMLLAVLERRVGFKIAAKDVFVNIAGGLRATDPAMDLAVIAAIQSSTVDIPIDADTCVCGEVGLSGEIRPVARIEQRVAEAQKLGFRRILIPAYNLKAINPKNYDIQIVPVRKVHDAVRELFG